MLPIPANCVTHWEKFSFFLSKSSLQIRIKFLDLVAQNIRTESFRFSPLFPDCRPHRAFHDVYICWVFLTLLQFFRLTIGNYFSHCFKIKNKIILSTIENATFTYKCLKFYWNTTAPSQSHTKNFPTGCMIFSLLLLKLSHVQSSAIYS